MSSMCRYSDFKTSPWEENPYQHNSKFWHIWFARLLFVVMFENILSVTVMTLRLAIPDISSNLKYKIRREEYITKEIIIRTERLKKMGKLRNKLSESDPDIKVG